MTHDEVEAKLTTVFRDVFDAPALKLAHETTADDIEGWDSVTHVNLIVAVEKLFALRFTTKEIKALANVGDFIRLIQRRAS
jgi:acyl carrier protein